MRILFLFIFFIALNAHSQDTTATSLDTVIINTGYEKIKPNEANGAVTVISNKTLNQQTGTNILQRLNNVSSGLLFNIGKSNGNPQNKTNISIRGLSTINGPLDPLIVLDNFIYEGSIDNINPNDVENITILKDAAATSIYGARGGNGVIVITTKKARFVQRTRVEANSSFMISGKPDLSAIPQVSTAELIDLETYLFNQGYFDSEIMQGYTPLTPLIAMLLARRNGSISAEDSARQVNTFKTIDTREQYEKYFYRQALTQQHAVNIRGGSDKIAWLASATYNRSRSELDARNNKVNLRFNNVYRPVKALQVELNVYFTSSDARSGKPGFSQVSRVGDRYVPYLSFVDQNGNPQTVTTNWRQSITDTIGRGLLLDWNYRPLEEYKLSQQRSRIEDIVASIGLTYQVRPWLNVQLSYQHQRQLSSMETHSAEESYYARNIVNQFSQIDYTTNSIRYIVPKGGILSTNDSRQISRQGRLQLNGSHAWNNHRLTAFAGAEIREIETSGGGQTLYGYREDPLIYTAVDFTNPYPSLITGWNMYVLGPPALAVTNSRFVSLYGNFSYSWKDRYHATASARRDGSNILGVKPNNQWKPLWSAGLGWTMSKEDFYTVDWLPYLKFRATYGKSGNVDLSLSALPIAYYQINYLTQLPSAQIEVLNNPSLRWEQVAQWNAGVEFGTKNNRLTGSIDYYRKYGTDLYGETPYDYTAWGLRGSIKRNVAAMKGTGIDVQLNARVTTGQLKWNVMLLYNYNRAITTKYYSETSKLMSQIIGEGTSINPSIGKPMYIVASYRWGGLDNEGDPMGYLDGKLSKDYLELFRDINRKGESSTALVIEGAASPTMYGSVINSINWKGFNLSVNISYRLGYYFRKPALAYGSLVQNGEGHSEYIQRWQKPGDETHTNVPAFKYSSFNAADAFYTSSSIHVGRADHLRLEYIHLSHSWKFTELYINAANLGVIWKANNFGVDPDYAGRIAPVKSFTIGARLNF